MHTIVDPSTVNWKRWASTAHGTQMAAGLSLARTEEEFKKNIKLESQIIAKKWEKAMQNLHQENQMKTALDQMKNGENNNCKLVTVGKFQREQLVPMSDPDQKQLIRKKVAQTSHRTKSQVEQAEELKRFSGMELHRTEILQGANPIDHQGSQQRQNLQDINRQLQKQQTIFERNKEIRRQQALEAMRMAQEREERIKRDGQIREGQKVIVGSESEAATKERERLQLERTAKASRIQAALEGKEWKTIKGTEQASESQKNLDVGTGNDDREISAQMHFNRKLLPNQMDQRAGQARTETKLQYKKNSTEKENQTDDELVPDSRTRGRPIRPLLKPVHSCNREQFYENNFIPGQQIFQVPMNNNFRKLCRPSASDPAIIEMTPAMPPVRLRYEVEQLKNMNPLRNFKK